MNGRGLHHHAPVTPDEVLAETLRLRPGKANTVTGQRRWRSDRRRAARVTISPTGACKASTLIAAAFKVSACGESSSRPMTSPPPPAITTGAEVPIFPDVDVG